jgi:hypothetical protein
VSGKFQTYNRQAILAAKVVGAYTGHDLGPAFSAGAEAGLRIRPRPNSALLWGGHFSFEYGAPQSIQTPRIDANFRNTALRAALDLGAASGRHAAILALGAGVDVVRIAPTSVRDPSLTLAPKTIDAVPALRAELRYELSFARSTFRLLTSLFADTSLAHTHYDITEGVEPVRVASPWLLRPGISLGLAWSPTLSSR